MIGFVRNLVLTFALLLTAIILLEYLFKDNFNFIQDKFHSIEQDDSSQVLILGNSHSQALKRPVINDMTSFNFAVGGQDIYHMLIIAEHVLNKQKNKTIKYIIVGLDYHLMGYSFQTSNTEWMDRLYYPDTKKIANNTIGGRFMAKSNFFRGNRNFKEAIKHFKFINSNTESKKAKKVNETFVDMRSSCQNRAIEHSVKKFEKSLIGENLSYLKRLSQLCNKHGVLLIFINYPKKACYYRFYNDNVVSIAVPKIRSFCEEHNITFLDYWKSDQFTDDMFIDNDHFNEAGANKMKSILGRVLNRKAAL